VQVVGGRPLWCRPKGTVRGTVRSALEPGRVGVVSCAPGRPVPIASRSSRYHGRPATGTRTLGASPAAHLHHCPAPPSIPFFPRSFDS
jgi:hypothetical protein